MWTGEEDRKLVSLALSLGPNWKIISSMLGHSTSSCQDRYEELMALEFEQPQSPLPKNLKEKGTMWTGEEDRKLVSRKISPMVGNSTSSCQDRYEETALKFEQPQSPLPKNLKEKGTMWTGEEDKKLVSLALSLGPKWKKISRMLGHRTSSCQDRYEELMALEFEQPQSPLPKNLKEKGTMWTGEEDRKLVSRKISPMVGNSTSSCQDRYEETALKFEQPQSPLPKNLKEKGTMWTGEEDKKLVSLALSLGPKWKKISRMLGHRTSSCRDRYEELMALEFEQPQSPLPKNLKEKEIIAPRLEHAEFPRISQSHSPKNFEDVWTKDEDMKLLSFASTLSGKWTMISDLMGVSVTACKERYLHLNALRLEEDTELEEEGEHRVVQSVFPVETNEEELDYLRRLPQTNPAPTRSLYCKFYHTGLGICYKGDKCEFWHY